MDNSIAVCKDKCKNDAEFWCAVAQLIRILTEQDYQVLFRYEDCGVYVIDIAHDQHKEYWGSDRFMKVTAEEEEDILWKRENPDSNAVGEEVKE